MYKNLTQTIKKNISVSFVALLFGALLLAVTFSGRQVAELLSPLPAEYNVFDTITPKLSAKVNHYKVTKSPSFISTVEAGDITKLNAYGVIDFDSGRVLAESNLSEPISIASLTKIMTAVVALDLANPDDEITVTQNAADMIPTKIVVLAGEKMTLRELLHASLLTSANDATQAIADGIDAKYGEKVFIESMNKKAEILKLKNSHFTNSQGFDNREHYSTVEDLAVLTHYAMQHYPLIHEIVKEEKYYLEATNTHRAHPLPNWNGLIGVYPETMGMKIGNTRGAGHTTVVISQRAGKKIMAIVLGATSGLERDMKAAELLDQGYQMTLGIKPVNVTIAQLQEKYATWNSLF